MRSSRGAASALTRARAAGGSLPIQRAAGDTASGAKTLTKIFAFNMPDTRFRSESEMLRAGCK